MHYRIQTTIRKIEHKTRVVSTYKGADGEIVTSMENLGWFVNFEGSWEYLYLGTEEPQLKQGQKVTITISPA